MLAAVAIARITQALLDGEWMTRAQRAPRVQRRLPRAMAKEQNCWLPPGRTLGVRPRQIAPVALVLTLTIAGFFVARLLGERDARRDSERRAEVAAAQIRGRVEQGASLAESLRRFMVSVAGSGVTSHDFAGNAS